MFLYVSMTLLLANLDNQLLTDLSRKIMRGITLALGASADAFEGEIAGDPFWVLRIIGYPGLSHANGQDMQKNGVGW